MKAIEELGITKEYFDEMYERCDGFDYQNVNSPIRDTKTDFYSYLKDGAKSLASDNADIVKELTLAGHEVK